jgi:hypothetical protein
MTFADRINDEYFEWLCELIDSQRFSKHVSYRKLLMRLHGIEFTWFIPRDDNRADDGIQLRRRYALYHDDMSLTNYITGPCSVLEMMVALAIRCEETIMDDTRMGDRTGQWFWGMIHNLGLTPMTDQKFDKHFVDDVINRFLNRDYEPNGKGGLFTVRHCDYDLRKVEIWCQLSWYLGSIT